MSEAGLEMNDGLKLLDYAAVVCYLFITFGIAVWFGRKQKSSEDFFIGGRHIPWFAVGLSILATLFSTLSYLGTPGEVIKYGIGFYCGYLALPFSIYVITRLWIPFYMKLGLTSAYEYLEHRYNYTIRCIGAVLFVLLRLGWMSMVVYAASMALDHVKGADIAILPGPDLYWWMGAISLIAGVYSAVGGIQAQIWTDVLQCLLLLAGAVMVIAAVMMNSHSTPVDWLDTVRTQTRTHLAPPFFSWDVTLRVTIFTAVINNFFWAICTHGSDQVVLQRYFSTSSVKSARRSYFISLATELTMIGLLSICGFALLTFYLQNPQLLPEGWTIDNSADQLFPHFLNHQLPAGCAGLVISAFLCDAIQTLEAGVNSITAVITTDLLPRRSRQDGSVATLTLTQIRILSFVITLIVSLNAVGVAQLAIINKMTIIDMMPKFFNLFIGPLAAMFIVGMFIPRCTARSVSIGVSVGVVTAILWNWGSIIFQTEHAPTMLLAIAVPCTVTILVSAICCVLIDDHTFHPGRRFTWRAIVQNDTTPFSPPHSCSIKSQDENAPARPHSESKVVS